MGSYSRRFYVRREQRVRDSAAALSAIVAPLLSPRSVIDIGCANGLWLEAFAGQGCSVVHGVDGPWVPRDRLRIPGDSFTALDFARARLPFGIDPPQQRFDLLVSLELLEHLPADRAEAMIDLMCSLSDTLLVSAAVPHQGGTGHVNEQWPDHWIARFRARGYAACDFLRPALWTDERIAPWYRQNIIGYFKGGVPDAVRAFARSGLERLIDNPLPLCHPGVFSYKLGKLRGWLKHPFANAMAELSGRVRA